MPRHPDNLTDQQIGRLTVIKRSPSRRTHWVCRCQCGAIRVVRADTLQQRRSTSCGCYRDELSKERKGQPKPKRTR